MIDKRIGKLGNKYNIIEIGHNSEKSPGYLRRLAFTQNLVRNHRLTLVGKTRKIIIIIIITTHKILWDFGINTDHRFSARRSDRIMINKKKKKKRTCKIVDFAVLADYRIKLKECEKKDKYLDLARELKKTGEHAGDNYTNSDWCFGTVTKGLLKGLEELEVGGRVETIKTTALLRTARILRRVLGT